MADQPHDAGVDHLAAVVHGMVGLGEQGAVMWALRLGVELRVLRGSQHAAAALDWQPGRVTVVVVDDVVVESFVA